MKQNPEKWGNCIKNHNCIKNGNHTLICKSLIYEKKKTLRPKSGYSILGKEVLKVKLSVHLNYTFMI